MRKKITALILIAAMLASMSSGLALAAPQRFSDLSGHWSEPVITELAELGIIQGLPDGTVRPEQTITRAEFACLVARLLEMHDHVAEGDPTFDDTYDNWAHHYIEALVSAGVLDPSSVSFNPTVPITRIDMTKLLVAAIGRDGHAAGNNDPTIFDDDDDIDPTHKGIINIARLYGLVNGLPDNTFNAYGISTRAEAFTVVSRFYDAAEAVTQEELQQTKDTGSASGTDNTAPAESGSGVEAPSEKDDPVGTPSPDGDGGSAPDTAISGLSLPRVLRTDMMVALKLELPELGELTVAWSLEKDTSSVTLTDYIEGTLGDNGGTIRFKEPGVYTLTVTVTDMTGRQFTASASTTVYPVIGNDIGLPQTAEADETDGSLHIELEGTENMTIVWSLMRNGSPVVLADYIEGALDKTGGDIKFKVRGLYVLTASVTDTSGRTHDVSSTVTYYPDADIEFTLPASLYTDSNHNLTTTLTHMDDLTAVWSLTYNGSPATIADHIEGTLTNDGGSIRFKQEGAYVLTATITDELSRETSYSGTVEVHPVAGITFSLPEYLHTDDTHALTATLDNIGGLSVQWKLKRDGSDVTLSDYIEGTLTDSGGSIRFKQKGVYELIAVVTDTLYREFEVSDFVAVYPVLDISFTLPGTTYTDSNNDVTVQVTEQ